MSVFAIDLLHATQTVTGAMGILRISWDQTWHIPTRAVERGQARKEHKLMPRLGIDEKAFKKGQSYMTMLFDLDNSTVEAISEGNNTESGIACFSQLSTDQINAVEAIAMDMSAAYAKAAKASLPLAEEKIVHDIFHVMKLVNKAVVVKLVGLLGVFRNRAVLNDWLLAGNLFKSCFAAVLVKLFESIETVP